MKTQNERNEDLINSYDTYRNPPDEYYDDMDRTVRNRIRRASNCYPAYNIVSREDK